MKTKKVSMKERQYAKAHRFISIPYRKLMDLFNLVGDGWKIRIHNKIVVIETNLKSGYVTNKENYELGKSEWINEQSVEREYSIPLKYFKDTLGIRETIYSINFGSDVWGRSELHIQTGRWWWRLTSEKSE